MALIGFQPLLSGAWLELDLLRRRREANGLKAPRPVAVRALLWRGGLIGGSLAGVVVLACLAALLYLRWLERRELLLADAAAVYDRTQVRVEKTDQELRALQSSNRALAQGIAGVRSGSAVLKEISRVIPGSLQLTKLKVLSSSLELSGLANQPLGLESVNGFLLQLEGSPFFKPDGVTLVKAVEAPALNAGTSPSPGTSPAAVAPPLQVLQFDLTAMFPADVARLTRSRLEALGSIGLARRLAWLDREGLLP